MLIMLPLCNNSDYCKKYLRRLDYTLKTALIKRGWIHKWCIYISNTTDDTYEMSKRALPHAKIIMGKESSDGPRCIRMARMRNAFKKAIEEDIKNSLVCLLLDSNVVFAASDIHLLMANLARSDAGMVTAGTRSCGTLYHYYDTFAFWGLDDPEPVPHPSFCPFLKCKQCGEIKDILLKGCGCNLNNKDCDKCISNAKRAKDRTPRTVIVPGTTVKVNSAFAGLALISSNLLLKCDWKSSELNECEHLAFCKSIRDDHGKNIYLVSSTRSVYWK